ncbi:DciA family protein [Luteimonas sp. MJ246]|uniref:DciA family protein n=1 Tax=Luteimonas sp. MJ174 TaxID=3129237 RepID=UPI0031BA9E94
MSSGNANSVPPKGPRAVFDALAADVSGRSPIQRAMWLDALDRTLRPHLPPSLSAHARLANVDGARLVYLVDSPLWNASLRLAAPALLDAARSHGLKVRELRVKTTTQPLFPPARVEAAVRPLSASAPEGLRAALASLREAIGNDRDAS